MAEDVVVAVHVGENMVEAVSRMADLELSRARIREITPRLSRYMDLFYKLDELDMTDCEPATVFNAEWS